MLEYNMNKGKKGAPFYNCNITTILKK